MMYYYVIFGHQTWDIEGGGSNWPSPQHILVFKYPSRDRVNPSPAIFVRLDLCTWAKFIYFPISQIKCCICWTLFLESTLYCVLCHWMATTEGVIRNFKKNENFNKLIKVLYENLHEEILGFSSIMCVFYHLSLDIIQYDMGSSKW